MKNFLLPTSYFLLKKNLLAFSAGIDSSALFFLLIEYDIPFDIAIVDYGVRTQSKEEVAHAQTLAKQYDLICHTITAPTFESNFESQARTFRYQWFESLIAEYSYDTLLTAHQLNDQLEWFLMRLTRGAGLNELIGMETVQKRSGYTLVRPLLAFSKAELLEYLTEHNYPYFVDESNHTTHHERNRFRHNFSDPLIEQYEEGIRRSFAYLTDDRSILRAGFALIHRNRDLQIFRVDHPRLVARAADQALKELGYLLSAPQRREIERNSSLVIGGAWAVECIDDQLWIAPYDPSPMPKPFKETCRIHRIPSKIRAYLYRREIDPATLQQLIHDFEV